MNETDLWSLVSCYYLDLIFNFLFRKRKDAAEYRREIKLGKPGSRVSPNQVFSAESAKRNMKANQLE